MASLGRVIVEAIVHHYGRDEVLRRLAHPFWFQSSGSVMGLDWHASGITTSVLGALKRGLGPIEHELGLHICGGKGAQSRKTPDELIRVGEQTGLDATSLTRASKLVAKVDSAAAQDGFDLYLHSLIVTDDGRWCVVQQGMYQGRREARRYHWLSESLQNFLDSPHTAIEGANHGVIVNLADARAYRSREAGLTLVRDGPDRTIAVLRQLREMNQRANSTSLDLFSEAETSPVTLLPHLVLPAHHDIRASNVVLKRLHGALAAAADRGPTDFADLLLTPGVGARTVASLALVAEVVHGTPSRFADPARFAMAHGGKDGHPFPVPLAVYDETIRVLRQAVDSARLGKDDKLAATRRLDTQARALERLATGPSFEAFIAQENSRSAQYGGRTVSGPAATNATCTGSREQAQHHLFPSRRNLT